MINNAVIRHCMDDLEIDENSAVLGSDSWPVAVLYAAGEVAGEATTTIDWKHFRVGLRGFRPCGGSSEKMEGSKLAGGSSEDTLVLHGRVPFVFAGKKRMIWRNREPRCSGPVLKLYTGKVQRLPPVNLSCK